MATHTTFDTVGLAESVDDVLKVLDNKDTPFYSSIKSESVNAKLVEWFEEEYDAGGDNAATEGADPTDTDIAQPEHRSNVTQIFNHSFKIAGTVDAVKTYGRMKESARALTRALRKIKSDVEFAMVGKGPQAAVLGDKTTPRRFANVWAQIDAGNIVDAGTSALDENELLTAGQKLYQEGADASVLMLKPSDSLKLANFASAAGRTRDFSDSKEVVNVVNIYVSPFGTYKAVINRHINQEYALLYAPSSWKTGVLRGFTRTLLAKTGDYDRHMIVGEITLKHQNQKGTAAIRGLTQ